MVFHQEQREAGFQIIDKFRQGLPFTVLLAQMQSGKTGTYLFTAFEMIRQGLVKRVVIICGSSDTSLRDQTIEAVNGGEDSDGRPIPGLKGIFERELLEEGREGMQLMQDIVFRDPSQRRSTTTKLWSGVFFSNDLEHISDIGEDTLIIHDEAHMAQSKNNKPFKKFYQRNNLDKALMGDFDLLKEKRNYILAVSATPFSEIVANKKVLVDDWTSEESDLLQGVELDAKNFHSMEAGAGYIGVAELLRNNCIQFKAKNIKAGDCEHIASILREGLDLESPGVKYHKRYVVVRTRGAKTDENMMETIATSCGYRYVSIFGGTDERTGLDFMGAEPFGPTLVHISGRFRMGQVVPKRYIACVYEQSSNPHADTILQGLVGRMCGYASEGAHTNVDIYVSSKAEELIRKYGRAWSADNLDRSHADAALGLQIRREVVDILAEVSHAMNLGGVLRSNGG